MFFYINNTLGVNTVKKSKRPIGLKNGELQPCPKTPNCVSTQATDAKHRLEPIKYDISIDEAKEKLRNILSSLKRTIIITDTEKYIHAEVRTATFKFVDDVEFLFDDSEKLIHFRSAARSGMSDMGVNKKRMKKIQRLFLIN